MKLTEKEKEILLKKIMGEAKRKCFFKDLIFKHKKSDCKTKGLRWKSNTLKTLNK